MQVYRQVHNKDPFHARVKACKRDILEYLIDEEKHLLEDYQTAMMIARKPVSVVTQTKNFATLVMIVKLFGKKSWLNMTVKEMDNLGAKIMSTYSPDGSETWTTYDCKKILRLWFRFIKTGERDLAILQKKGLAEPPELVHINPTRVEDKLAREQMVTSDEMARILNATTSFRDKALIHVHSELGTRIGETLSIQLKHIIRDDGEDFITIYVDGKTGTRKVRVYEAKNSLMEWLSHHPNEHDPEAQLWASQVEYAKGESVTYEAARVILKNAVKRAGIKRRIYWHLFRHTRATISATKYNDGVLKKMYGWSATTKMLARYTHIVDEDVDDAFRKAYGLGQGKSKIFDSTKPKPCINCGKPMSFESKYCPTCGKPQKKESGITEGDTESRLTELEKALHVSQNEIVEMAMNQIMAKFMSDPDGLRNLLEDSKQYKSIN